MSRESEFLIELKKRLAHLPLSETGKVLSFYSESLQDKIEDGMTEEEAIKSFGSIDEIVRNLEDEIPLSAVVKDKVKTKTSTSNVNGVLLVLVLILGSPIWISLLAVAFGVAVAIIAVLWTIPITFVSLYVSLYPIAISGIFFGFARMFEISFPTGLAYLGVGIISAGLAVMFFKPVLEGCKFWIRINLYPFKKLKQWLIKKA